MQILLISRHTYYTLLIHKHMDKTSHGNWVGIEIWLIKSWFFFIVMQVAHPLWWGFSYLQKLLIHITYKEWIGAFFYKQSATACDRITLGYKPIWIMVNRPFVGVPCLVSNDVLWSRGNKCRILLPCMQLETVLMTVLRTFNKFESLAMV